MKRIAYLLLSVLLVGCGQSKKDVDEIELISIPSGIEVLDMADVLKSVSFIQPEITDQSLITSTSRVYRLGGKIYIGSENAILVFGEDGSFIRRIEHQGNGPGEYVRLTDFDISEETIFVLDNNSQQVLLYDLNGEFVKKIGLNFWAIRMKAIGKNSIALFSGNQTSSTENVHKVNLIDTQNGEVLSKCLPIDPRKSEYLHMFSANNFSTASGETLLAELYNDTIYTIGITESKPTYVLDFGSDKIPDSFFDNGFEDIMQFQEKFTASSFSYGYNTILNMGKGFLCSIYLNKVLHYFYHEADRSVVFDAFKLQDIFGDFSVNIREGKVRFAQNNNVLFITIDSGYYQEHIDQIKNERLKQAVANSAEDDNPIILIGELK